MLLRESFEVLEHTGRNSNLDPWRPNGFFVEPECAADGFVVDVATVLLTNRECPWRCVMCDLWKNTLEESVPPGAIPEQIQYALDRLPVAQQIKLYNSGSFFDRRAIPNEDFPAIARLVSEFKNVVVESHPALLGESALRFRDLLIGGLEVAMGLETAHPQVLARLRKGMTLGQFANAAEFLDGHAIQWRAFILLQPPYMQPEASLEWAARSLQFAFDQGAGAATLIPTRATTAEMKQLERAGQFTLPSLSMVEAAFESGLESKRGRVFLDLWDLERNLKARECADCFDARYARLQRMNLNQATEPLVSCDVCGAR